MKVGLGRNFDPSHLEAMEKVLAGKRVADLMTRPAVVVRKTSPWPRPWTSCWGRTSSACRWWPRTAASPGCCRGWTCSGPSWTGTPTGAFDPGVKLQDVTLAKDAMRPDTPVLPPSAPVWDAIQLIDATSINRVAVVDPEGKLLGLVSDKVLMAAFSAHKGGILDARGQALLHRAGP